MSIPLLEGLPPELLANIHPHGRFYRKNSVIYESGDLCTTLSAVISGRLVAYTPSAAGNETAVFTFAPGAVLGANLLFAEEGRYPLRVYCEQDCELLSVERQDVEYLLRRDAEFVMRFIRIISATSLGMNRRLSMFSQKTLRENILDYLRTLSAEQHSDTVRLPMSKKQLADYLGVQRPSLFRELKRMREEGLLETDNREIRLLETPQR